MALVLKLKSKNSFLAILSIIILLIIIVLVYFIFFRDIQIQNKSRLEKQEVLRFSQKVKTTVNKNKKDFIQGQINEALGRLRDEQLSLSDRNEALKDIQFNFSTAYAISHKPEIREFSNEIDSFAKNNFPGSYRDWTYIISCADPTCGETPDEEIKQIQKEINDTGIIPAYLHTINTNLEQAIYIPKEQMDEKKYGFGLVIADLKLENNPKASAAADKLIDYIKRKYGIELLGNL